MSMTQVVKSACSHCFSLCGILIHVEDGIVKRIEGDPESPINRGVLCPKAAASIEYLYHPDRLKYPLKRTGERGEGKWARVSWDEALDTIAGKFMEIKDNYGAESLFLAYGQIKGLRDTWLQRLGNVFGTPNITCTSYVCTVPRILGSLVTHGFRSRPDLEYPPDTIIVWGCNPSNTAVNEHQLLVEALDKGAKLIIINPRSIDLADRAHIWIQPRPASDLALALSMINVIINEGLYDKAFIDNWTVGFDRLVDHVQNYPPEKVEDITWVPAEKIKEVARLYATARPSCILDGNGFDHNLNSFQSGRALAILRTITGNLCIPAGEVNWIYPSILQPGDPALTLAHMLKTGEQKILGDVKDLGFIPVIPTVPILNTILTEDPYPIRAVYIQGTNLICNTANSKETLAALKKLELVVVAELFMTPTADLADFVLPVTSSLECDTIACQHYPVAQIQQKVAEPVGESWPEYKIISGLARRLGLEKYFWDTEEEAFDFMLEQSGLTFQEFKTSGAITGTKLYKEYEPDGFPTPSKKVEIYSNLLEAKGLDPLPVYYEAPETPYSDSELAKEYPLIFTNKKSVYYHHSEGRQIKGLRDAHPEPLLCIHPETAGKLGISEGDLVYIETKRGRIKQKANLTTDIDPRVVYVDYGWWFPEKSDNQLHAWSESNINILTNNKPPYGREVGSTNLVGTLCKVYKVSE